LRHRLQPLPLVGPAAVLEPLPERESLALAWMSDHLHATFNKPAETAAWLARNAVDCLPEGALAEKLKLGRPLRVKLGIDPTAPDIHLGFTVVLQKMREFQDAGHTVVLIIGNGTARVGDPSGRSATRPVLSDEEITRNARTFEQQALKILDPNRLEVRFNGDWLEMSMGELFRLMSTTTVAHVIERDDFANRLAAGTPVSMLELLYPLLQGYDSVAIKADVELGGTDQKFNLLLGRDIQRAYGMDGQVILTMPLLTGTDGEKKMSKSLGNYIGVTEPPEEIYGKTLSIPDSSLQSWYSLLIGEAPDPALTARDSKRALARALVERFYDGAAAGEAEAAFDRVHVRREVPKDVPEVEWAVNGGDAAHLPALIAHAFGVSSSEARRSLSQGGVRIDGEVVPSGVLDLPREGVDGRVLQLGKRRFAKIRLV